MLEFISTNQSAPGVHRFRIDEHRLWKAGLRRARVTLVLGICPNQSMKTKFRRIKKALTGTLYFPENAGALPRIFEEAAGF